MCYASLSQPGSTTPILPEPQAVSSGLTKSLFPPTIYQSIELSGMTYSFYHKFISLLLVAHVSVLFLQTCFNECVF